MGALSRTKGRAGEQECARIIRDWLGVDIHRNWQQQSAEGGSDLAGLPGYAIEVKRSKLDRRSEWWEQTIAQADDADAKPVLLFRIDGHGRGLPLIDKWHAVVRLCDFGLEMKPSYTAVVSMRTWMDWMRENMPEQEAA